MSGLGPGWSDDHSGQSDDGIIAQGRHGFQGHVAGALDRPFVILLEQDRPDQTSDCVVIGEDADDLGAAFDFAVEPLEPVGNRYESPGADLPAAGEEPAAYGATIRDRGAGSTKVWAGRSTR